MPCLEELVFAGKFCVSVIITNFELLDLKITFLQFFHINFSSLSLHHNSVVGCGPFFFKGSPMLYVFPLFKLKLQKTSFPSMSLVLEMLDLENYSILDIGELRNAASCPQSKLLEPHCVAQ